jgi:hypothetical protein
MLATASLELKVEKQSAHNSSVMSVAFSPDGSTIVSGSLDKTIKVWDAGVSALTPTPRSFKSEHPLAFVAASLELKAEKQNAHAMVVGFMGGQSIAAVQFSPDGSTIVSCGADKTIKVWDAGMP